MLELQQDEEPPIQAVWAEVNVTTPESPSAGLWQPPVDLSHLGPEQQRLVEEMLSAESAAFACDSRVGDRCQLSFRMTYLYRKVMLPCPNHCTRR